MIPSVTQHPLFWHPYVPEEMIEWIICGCDKKYRTVIGANNHMAAYGYSPWHQVRQIVQGYPKWTSGRYR